MGVEGALRVGQPCPERFGLARQTGVLFGRFGLLRAETRHHLYQECNFLLEPVDWFEIGRTHRYLLCHECCV